VAFTKFSNRQLKKLEDSNKVLGSALDITGSAGSAKSSVVAADSFIIQDSSNVPQKVLASTMQDFFSKVDVDASDANTAFKIVFSAGGDGADLLYDGELTYNPNSDSLVAANLNVSTALSIGGTAITSTAAELNILDGVTSTAAELNILDGVTSTAAELNLIDGSSAGAVVASKAAIHNSAGSLLVTDDAYIGAVGDVDMLQFDGGSEINVASDLDFVIKKTGGLQLADGAVTSTAAELNLLDGVSGLVKADFTKLAGVDASAAELNILDGVTSTAAELNILDGVTSTAAELNILDGVTSTATELNILDGVTATATELNYLDITTLGTSENSKAVTQKSDGTIVIGATSGNQTIDIASHDAVDGGLKLAGTLVTATAAELNIMDGVTATAAEINILDGVTSTAAELNILDGVTSTAAELNILDGVTSTAAELNILDGVTATATEINVIDGSTGKTATTVADGDRVVFNDAGTMKQVEMSDLGTYFGAGAGITVSSEGQLSITYTSKQVSGSAALTNSVSSSLGAEPLMSSVQVFLNGALLTVSASTGLGSATWDYEIYGGTNQTIQFASGLVQHDDAIQINYISK
jgi:hypothetical protein